MKFLILGCYVLGHSTFFFGISVQPEGPNKRACERTTAEFETIVQM